MIVFSFLLQGFGLPLEVMSCAVNCEQNTNLQYCSFSGELTADGLITGLILLKTSCAEKHPTYRALNSTWICVPDTMNWC